MKVCVIGAGFSGLSIAYYLTKNGVDVDVIEAESNPGGMAIGFENDRWKWSLEKHYHHWFVSDWFVRNLAEEVGQKYLYVRPKSSTFINNHIYQLDSPTGLLGFDEISMMGRLRTGLSLGFLKALPFWKTLESITAKDYIIKTMGTDSWNKLWKPLFLKKYGKHSRNIPASWFWARIKKRSPSLGYPVGGFLSFARKLDTDIGKNGGRFLYNTKVKSVEKKKSKLVVGANNSSKEYDSVVCTLPSSLFTRIVDGLPKPYIKNITRLKGLGAVNLVLSLNENLLEEGNYWLNVNEKDFPFVAVVEHTNFMDKKYYNSENLVYVANYVEHSHKYFKSTPEELLKEYMPYLRRIGTGLSKKTINDIWAFKAYFAQPIIPLGYSRYLPDFETPIKSLYLCNIQQVYPWDRGTNYAVENGQKVANMILESV